jgi:uncharacterized protein (DUF952 family)
MNELIYHMCHANEWEDAEKSGAYRGSSQDQADGFIHFSTADQVRVSAAKHRSGQDGLVLLSVSIHQLGDALKWEKSRGGDLFPHLYGDLMPGAVVHSEPLLLDESGLHVFPRSIS